MPRSRKSAAQKRADKERDKELAQFWSGRIKAATEDKEDYVNTATRVDGYMKPQHDHLFQDEELEETFMSFKGSLGVSVPKIPQMKNSLAPRLYMPEPERNVAYRGSDTVMLGLARVLQTYLTYTAKETNQPRELRQSIDDGILRGRALLRQIWDPVRKLITSKYVSSMHVLFDPDFEDPKDARWVAIRHREPLWELERRINNKKITKGLDKRCLGTNDEEEEKDYSVKIVEWWEILSKMGCGYHGVEFEGEKYKDDKDFVRLEIVVGHDRILSEGDWDVPLYLDREYPLSWVDLVEIPDRRWPESVPGLVLSCQGAVDLLTSLKLNSCKQRERVIVGCDKSVDQQVKDTLRNGSAADMLEFAIPAGKTLEGMIKVFDFGQGCPDTNIERNFLLQEMETTMGSTQILTGGQDAGPADRSATASNMRNEATDTRVGDFKAKVNELYTDASRKEAVMVRLFLTEEDVARYVRPSDLALFCIKLELPDTPPMPVRRVSLVEDDGELKEQTDILTIQDIDPTKATYFETMEEAAMAMQELWLGMQASVDMQIGGLRDALVQGGVDPMTGIPMGMGVDAVTAERVWQDTSGMTAEEILDELSYTIGTSSGIKFSKQAERESADMLLQTLLPVVAQMGDIQGINKLLNMRFEAYDVPEDKRFVLTMPPPPPPGNDSGQPGEKGKKESGSKEKQK